MSRTLQEAEAQSLLEEGLDVVGLIGAINRSPSREYVGLGMTPLTCFYAIEAYDWLRKNRAFQSNRFLEAEAQRVRRIRARCKLFDDEGRVPEALRRQQIADEFNIRVFRDSHRGWLAPLKRWLQPDLGLFFLGPDLVGSTHVSTLNFGYDWELLSDPARRSMPPGEALRAFSAEIGGFVKSAVCTLGGVPNLNAETKIELSIFAEDHKSSKLYPSIAAALEMPDNRLAALLVAVTCQVNFTWRVVAPSLRSTLGFRLRFLSWYHAVTGLRLLAAHLRGAQGLRIGAFVSTALGRVGSRRTKKLKLLRNHLAHYSFAPGSEDAAHALDFTCREVALLPWQELDVLVTSELRALSELCRTVISAGRYDRTAVTD